MKYNYNKVLAVLQYILLVGLVFLVLFILTPTVIAGMLYNYKLGLSLMIVVVVYSVIYLQKYFRRYFELKETYIHCHSYISKTRLLTADVDVIYSNIYKITFKKFMFFEYIFIYEYNQKKPIIISFCIHEHKQLFCELAKKVKTATPKAFVDKRLMEM